MKDLLASAESELLAPAGLGRADVEAALGRLAGAGADYGEVFLQNRKGERWSLEDGRVKDGSFSVDLGVGVRAVAGEKTGAAYAEDIRRDGLDDAVAAACAIARGGGGDAQASALSRPRSRRMYDATSPISELSSQAKIDLLAQVDRAAREMDNRVEQVQATLGMSHEVMLVAATDGVLAADLRPLVRLDVSVIAVEGKRRERGSAGAGGRRSLTTFSHEWPADLAREAVRMALVNLDAVEAPAGPMPVVLGPGWPGVLLHEAVGHGLEGDFNRKGSSAFSGRLGEQVASSACTVVDDGAMPGRRGSLSVDDEGTPSGKTILIENGILAAYMQDKLNARLMGMRPTGNGRRQSYAFSPMPRMTNTYMQPGQHDPEEIIAACDRGIYAVNFGGGQVDITSGRFVFSATEAYCIEKGRVGRPVRGATLIGSGPEVMTRISMVGNDLSLDAGVGVCGKDGQSVPVGVGQPTLLIDEITVGGTSA